MAGSFTLIFLAFFAAYFIAELILLFLQRNNQKSPCLLVAQLKDHFEEATVAKSISYTKEKLNCALVEHFYSALVLLVILFSGLLVYLRDLSSVLTANSYVSAIIFVFFLILTLQLTSIPFDLYKNFKIEEKHGFNKMTLKLWLADLLKGLLLGLALLAPFLSLILYFINSFPEYWWLYSFVAFNFFQLVLLYVFPVWIAPVFNKFEPLTSESLREKIFALSEKLKFPLDEVFIMDGSKRSSHGNAYFTGFGKHQRIVLFDTLVDSLEENELLAVLAHEIGHKKLKHVLKLLFAQLIFSFLVFYIAGQLFSQDWFYQAFGFEAYDYTAGLVLLSLIIGPFSYFFSPLFAIVQRKYEFQADAYAREAVDGPSLANALIKLNKTNLSNLFPHPAYSFFHDSHPGLIARLREL